MRLPGFKGENLRNLRVAALPLCLFFSFAHGQEPLRVELGKDGETIADMRPVFLKFESRPLPAISPAEVARRYQRLFNTTGEPSVRVDALNRLTNIRDRSGEDNGFSPAEEADVYRQAIESYKTILERGVFGGRLDELLYQMAKAHALTGQHQASVKRLQQLVGLYPDSPLVPEAWFRIAESAFAAGDYAEAEAGYRKLVDGNGDPGELENKARYMLGWALFKQGPQAWERAGRTFVEVLDESLPNAESLAQLPESSVDTVDDTLRILALMASRLGGAETLMDWLQPGTPSVWAPLVFDRLADFYAVQGDAEASVATNRAFAEYFPEHPQRAGFMAQVVDVWNRAGQSEMARRAMADYISLFDDQGDYAALEAGYREKWREFSRFLADYYYAQGVPQAEDAAAQYSVAAAYYEGLASRSKAPGELFRLAGDARLQAEDYLAALANYRAAAYELTDYEYAADAGWAAIALVRAGTRDESVSAGYAPDLADLAAELDRYAEQYGSDGRVPGLLAELATHWLESGEYEQALRYGTQAVVHQKAAPDSRFAGWLVTAQVRQHMAEYGLAERAWREAITLASKEFATDAMKQGIPNLQEQLATAIYRQGEQAADAGKVSIAVAHFQRVETVLPGSETAIKGRFDAANTLVRASQWQLAINELNRFRNDYPQHALGPEISEKLVLAYTSSDQQELAAGELMSMADDLGQQPRLEGDVWGYRLRAAELFHTAGEDEQRNAVYEGYLASGPVALEANEHIRLQTMRYRLIEKGSSPSQWRADMVSAELKSSWHSEVTLKWAADGALKLGAEAAEEFASIELNNPLEQSLDRKQAAMARAQASFRNAESLGGSAVFSESLFRRAELHRIMARDLMASSAPEELNELEQMQYRMLLEEEAYPFEERAIALHSQNHRRITANGFNSWIGKSLGMLAELHPGRYSRSFRWMTVTTEGKDDA
ncbi:tetratricopeptide repeat protein [Marinobacter sp. 2_MG-2023]|uniref:tetratricopeptide repeat protein n=1 Tax=Marinobacter sp. 2_MG-2023 TaxID=3062679 RepID=UPI0026E2A4F8|nr:tetratricopeptide repeat protein [Marinobacter sp. 2_MG-2023]MDO6442488.1 tetratricopeptide repeat protein [Marinobacter sp. 2_MG-2023]